MTSIRIGCLVVVALLPSLVASAPMSASAAAGSPIVATDKGPVRGVATGEMQAFLGIPYAAAPIGDLRWRPPQEHPAWRGVRDASEFGAHCPQVASPYGKPSTSEDCLFLNVFAPGKTNQGRPHLLPVMFWMHGEDWSSERATATIPPGWSHKTWWWSRSTTGSASSGFWLTLHSGPNLRAARQATTA